MASRCFGVMPPNAGHQEQQRAGRAVAGDRGQLASTWAMRASSRRISSSSMPAVWRISSGTAERGSASTRAIVSTPVRAPCGMVMPNSRQKPRRALMREVRGARDSGLNQSGLAYGIHTMNSKDVLGEIDSSSDNGSHGLPLPHNE